MISITTESELGPDSGWDDVYPPLAELRREMMTDAQWSAMTDWEKDLWEMKHRPEEERLACIEQMLRWFPEEQRDRRRSELLEEVLAFGGPTSAADSLAAPGSSSGNPDASLVVPIDANGFASLTPTKCSTKGPSRGASELRSPSDSATAPSATVDFISILVTTAASDGALGRDAISGATPMHATCSTFDTAAVTKPLVLSPVLPLLSFAIDEPDKPTRTQCSIECSVDHTNMVMPLFALVLVSANSEDVTAHELLEEMPPQIKFEGEAWTRRLQLKPPWLSFLLVSRGSGVSHHIWERFKQCNPNAPIETTSSAPLPHMAQLVGNFYNSPNCGIAKDQYSTSGTWYLEDEVSSVKQWCSDIPEVQQVSVFLDTSFGSRSCVPGILISIFGTCSALKLFSAPVLHMRNFLEDGNRLKCLWGTQGLHDEILMEAAAWQNDRVYCFMRISDKEKKLIGTTVGGICYLAWISEQEERNSYAVVVKDYYEPKHRSGHQREELLGIDVVRCVDLGVLINLSWCELENWSALVLLSYTYWLLLGHVHAPDMQLLGWFSVAVLNGCNTFVSEPLFTEFQQLNLYKGLLNQAMATHLRVNPMGLFTEGSARGAEFQFIIIGSPMQPMFSGVLDIDIIGVADITKLADVVSHETNEVDVLAMVDIVDDDLGGDRRPPWPRPKLDILCSLGIQDLVQGSVLKEFCKSATTSFLMVNFIMVKTDYIVIVASWDSGYKLVKTPFLTSAAIILNYLAQLQPKEGTHFMVEQLLCTVLELDTSDAFHWGGEDHASEQLFEKNLGGVAFHPSFLEENGLARYICSTRALAPMKKILFEVRFTCVLLVCTDISMERSMGSDELFPRLVSYLYNYYHDLVYIFGTVCSDLKYYREDYQMDYNKLKEVQTPWDPGKSALQYPSKASAWGQAEFQEGRNVMTLACGPIIGLVSSWASSDGFGPTDQEGASTTTYTH